MLQPDGTPGAAARLWVWWRSPLDGDQREPVVTGADGRFAIERPDATQPYRLFAMGERYVGGYYGEPAVDLTVRTMPLAARAGKITDEQGRPLAGITVQLSGFGPPQADPPLAWAVLPDGLDLPDFRVVSDGEGRFTVPLPASGRTRYLITAPGRVTTRGVWQDEGQPLPPLVLRRAGAIAGRVVDDDGRPLAGVPVIAEARSSPPSYADVRTGDDGRFKLEGLPPTPHRLRCLSEGPDVPLYLPREGVAVTAGRTTELGDVLPSPGVPLTIALRRQGTGEPVVGVRCYARGEAGRVFAPTGDDGQTTGTIAPGRNTISLDRSTLPAGLVAAGPVEVDVVADAAKPPPPVVFEVVASVPVRGVLVDEAGRPLPHRAMQYHDGHATEVVRTDAAGRFVLRPMAPDAELRFLLGDGLTFDSDQRIEPRGPYPVPTDGELRLQVKPVPLTEVFVTVIDPAGRPVAGVTVELLLGRRAWPDDGYRYGDPQTAVSDAAGQCVFENIGLPWQVQVRVGGPGYRQVAGGELVTDLNPRPPLKPTPLVVELVGLEVAGQVLDEAGQPAAGALVYGLGQRPDEPPVTAAEGRFKLTGLRASTPVVIALRGEREYGRGVVGRGELSIRLAPLPAVEAMPPIERELLAGELLEQIWDRQPSLELLVRMARVDVAMVAEHAGELDAGDSPYGLPTMLRTVADESPAEALELAGLMTQIGDLGLRAWAAAHLACRLQPQQPDEAAKLAAQAMGWADAAAGPHRAGAQAGLIWYDDVCGRTAAADARLAELLARLDGIANRPQQELARVMALYGLAACPERVEALLQTVEDAELRAVGHRLAIEAASAGDPAAAVAWFNRWYGSGLLVDDRLDDTLETAVVLAEQLAPVDAGAALALALRIGDDGFRANALAAVLPSLQGDDRARGLAALQQAGRGEIWRRWPRGADAPALAARMLAIDDPDAGLAWFRELQEILARTHDDTREPAYELGFHLAWLRPNEGREVIDRALARHDPAVNGSWKIQQAIQALCVHWVDDAVALAAMYPDHQEALLGVVDWLLCDDRTRLGRPLGEWRRFRHDEVF